MGPENTPPTPPASPPQYTPFIAPQPPAPRRLTRSSRERMWAGVAGGLAEYFDLDPALVRLLWVVGTVVTGGLAVPIYILAWILLPRDDRPPYSGPGVWGDWSQEFHRETQRLAEEARRMADDVRDASQSWRAADPHTGHSAQVSDPSVQGAPSASSESQEWWRSEGYAERHRNHGRHPRSTGIVLVALGVLLLAANAGIFNWIEWRTMWPLIFIGLGVILLSRQSRWGR
jgi:phage shock protein C